MKTLSSPLVAACCYNICLLVDSEVIRVAQRPTRSSWNKGEQETWRKRTHTHVYDDREGRREKERRNERSVTIIMHRCPGQVLPCQNIFIAPLHSLPLPSFFFWPGCGVSAIIVTLSYGYYPLVHGEKLSTAFENKPRVASFNVCFCVF